MCCWQVWVGSDGSSLRVTRDWTQHSAGLPWYFLFLFPAWLIPVCINSGRTDRPQAFGEFSTVNSSFLGVFFNFWTSGVSACGCWELFMASWLHWSLLCWYIFGQRRELPIFQHREKGGKLFSGDILKHHLRWRLHQVMKQPLGSVQPPSLPSPYGSGLFAASAVSEELLEVGRKNSQFQHFDWRASKECSEDDREQAKLGTQMQTFTTRLLLSTDSGIWRCCLGLSRISTDAVHWFNV